jgi:hypothetical protein
VAGVEFIREKPQAALAALVIDGQNRLDAMELVGLPTYDSAGLLVATQAPSTTDPIALVVSGRRRRTASALRAEM